MVIGASSSDGDRVGDREQVAGRQPAERLRLGDADVALGEQRAQHRGQVRPRRAAAQAEQRDPAASAAAADLGGQRRPGRAGPARRRAARPSVAEQRRRPASGSSTPTPSTSACARQHRRVDRVVDDDAADVLARARGRRAPGRAGWRRGRRGPGRGWRAGAGWDWVMACSTLRPVGGETASLLRPSTTRSARRFVAADSRSERAATRSRW